MISKIRLDHISRIQVVKIKGFEPLPTFPQTNLTEYTEVQDRCGTYHVVHSHKVSDVGKVVICNQMHNTSRKVYKTAENQGLRGEIKKCAVQIIIHEIFGSKFRRTVRTNHEMMFGS